MVRVASRPLDDEWLTPEERRRRSSEKQQQVRARGLTPDWFTDHLDTWALPPDPVRVAVIGAGFSGLMAAWYLAQCGIDVTVFEAAERTGGRVVTDREFAKPHVVEAGAELIGENHGLWLLMAHRLGLGTVPLTEYPEGRRVLRGRELSPTDRAATERDVVDLWRRLGASASRLSETRPWMHPGAKDLDGMSVADGLRRLRPGAPPGELTMAWFAFTLGNDNCAPLSQQSHLGLLAAISAGRLGSDAAGMLGYWYSTETERCEDGNDQLAQRLGRGLRTHVSAAVTGIAIDRRSAHPVTITAGAGPSSGGPANREQFDFAVLTAPPTVWSAITVDPPFDRAGRTSLHGPAVKHLTRYPTRFWLQQSGGEHHPSVRSDELGSLWEGTDGQPHPPETGDARGPFVLSVFSGGPFVQQPGAYAGKVQALYPHGQPGPDPARLFVDWSRTPFVQTGYAVPGVGQVTTVVRALQEPHQGVLFFAGEQASPGFFGYMEGALQSGARAAREIVKRIVVLARPPEVRAAPRRRLVLPDDETS